LNYDFQQTLITKFKLLWQTRILRMLGRKRVFKRISKSHPPSICSNQAPIDEYFKYFKYLIRFAKKKKSIVRSQHSGR
jgi:hypothetical protein